MRLATLAAGLALASSMSLHAQPAPAFCSDVPGERLQVVSIQHLETGAPIAGWSAPGASGGTVTIPDGRRISFQVEPVDADYYRERRESLPLPEMVRVTIFEPARSMETPIHAGIAGANTVERYPALGVMLVLARPGCVHEIPAEG